MKKAASIFKIELKKIGDPSKARWLEKYVKHDIKSIGVGIPDITELVRITENSFQLSKRPIKSQERFLTELMSSTYSEEKLGAIIYIQLYWKEVDLIFQLELISNWFDNEWIYDWNICDWLCVRTLSRLLDRESNICIKELSKWNASDNLWKARASLVAFANCNTIEKFNKTIESFSKKLIRRNERFSKTAVGWLMREYSKIDEEYTQKFINEHIKYFTRETINNSLKYSSSDIRKKYLDELKVLS